MFLSQRAFSLAVGGLGGGGGVLQLRRVLALPDVWDRGLRARHEPASFIGGGVGLDGAAEGRGGQAAGQTGTAARAGRGNQRTGGLGVDIRGNNGFGNSGNQHT